MDCKRQSFGIFLTLSLLIAFLACYRIGAEEQAEPEKQGDFQYVTVFSDNAEIVGYTGSEKNLRIPDTLNDLPVTAIGSDAFSGTALVSVAVPEGVVTIGERAFADCPSLKSISLPSTLNSIAPSAFSGSPVNSRKMLDDDSPKTEIELYANWALCQDRQIAYSDTEPRNQIERKFDGDEITVEAFPWKEGSFDENAEIDGIVVWFGSIDSSYTLTVSSYKDRPYWYWSVEEENYIEEKENARSGKWNPQHGKQFFNELRSIGLFKWDRHYETPIACGLSWSVFVKFSNSDRYFSSSGSNFEPRNYAKFLGILRRYGFLTGSPDYFRMSIK